MQESRRSSKTCGSLLAMVVNDDATVVDVHGGL
jgi:hypothetical protein